mmetsp:Transcript_26785/g.49206  ORF Transcript_26785/g.49206 Transcript_26785/m.49206 type:complete len:218 (-) Transcript_26785:203-856(-)
MDDIAKLVREDLEFNVTRINDGTLDVDASVSEGGLSLVLGLFKEGEEILLAVAQTHATTTTTCGGLDHDGEANLLAHLNRLDIILDETWAARDGGDTGLLHGVPGSGFVTHESDREGLRTDKFEVMVVADLDKVSALGKETVTRVDGLSAAARRGSEEIRDTQVRFTAGTLANANSLISEIDMERVFICSGVDRNSLKTHFLASTNDTDSNLSTISN